jgi:hypothetical protein
MEEEAQEELEEVPAPKQEPRLARPDEHHVSKKPREKDIIWEFDGERLLSKITYKEVSWSLFADLMFASTDVDDNGEDIFNIKKYLIEASRQIVLTINGETVAADGPYSWKTEFGFALMEYDVIPKPQFGGGGAKNQ